MVKTVSFQNQNPSFYGAVFQTRFNQEHFNQKTYNENKSDNKQAYKHDKATTFHKQAQSVTSYKR